MSKPQFYRTPKPINQLTQLDHNDKADEKYKLTKVLNSAKIRAINRLVHIDEDQSYLPQQPKIQQPISIQEQNSIDIDIEISQHQKSKVKSTNFARTVYAEDFTSQSQSYLSESHSIYDQQADRKVTKVKNYLEDQDMFTTPAKNNKNLKIDHVYSHTEKRQPTVSTEISLKRSSEQKMRLQSQQVFSVFHNGSSEKSQKSMETRETVGEKIDFSDKIPQIGVNYSNYCHSCDDFMTTGLHVCARRLYNLQQISKSLQRISSMIEQTKMTKYSTLPKLINNTNKLHELRVFFDFLKKQKNNLILLPSQWNQNQEIVLKRLINVCGKKISLVI